MVNQALTTTTLTSSLNPSTFGAAITFTATVLPATASGTITFNDGSATLGTVTLTGGSAFIVTSGLSVGAHTITAVYSGDTNDSGSTSSAITQTVNQASSTITLDLTVNESFDSGPDRDIYRGGNALHCHTGTVTLNDGTSPLGNPVTLTGGAATFTISALTLGTAL